MRTTESGSKTTTYNNNRQFKFYDFGLKEGIMAGVAMGIFSLLLSLGSGDENNFTYVTYLILIGFLVYSLNKYHDFLPEGEIFKNGILMGAFISFVASVTLFLFNAVVFLTGARKGAFTKFTMEANDFGTFMMISGINLFEAFVFGMIASFAVLQFLKSKKHAA